MKQVTLFTAPLDFILRHVIAMDFNFYSCDHSLFSLEILDMYNPSRYMRDVPLSVLPSSTQIDNSIGPNNGSSSTSGTDSPSTKNLEEDPNTSHHNQNPVEFFISSDGSTILEHTNRVIYLEVSWFF